MAPATLAQWTAYTGLEGIPFTTIPGDWPGSSFWDYQHLNGAGRDAFLEWLLPLLVNDRFPAELPTTWNGASLPPPVGL